MNAVPIMKVFSDKSTLLCARKSEEEGRREGFQQHYSKSGGDESVPVEELNLKYVLVTEGGLQGQQNTLLRVTLSHLRQ
ncbi:unnamed protein product [Nezara viridula]|uniref:Uncharacterized protein n=1 Tax=Nezara viridula TaxID=85310 RepID=A0A9P0HRG2_NEZVI|nr:unnamed protein product [Nezara viridula]